MPKASPPREWSTAPSGVLPFRGKHFIGKVEFAEFGSDFFLLALAQVGFELENVLSVVSRNAELVERQFHFTEELVNFRQQTGRVFATNAKEEIVRAELEEFFDLDENDQSEQHHDADESGNFVESGARGHAHGGFEKNCRGSGCAKDAPLVAHDYASAQESNALDDVRGDARRACVTRHFGQLNGNDGKECGRCADKETCAEASGAL